MTKRETDKYIQTHNTRYLCAHEMTVNTLNWDVFSEAENSNISTHVGLNFNISETYYTVTDKVSIIHRKKY